MEWYSGSGVDDLVVPRGQELADGVPSSPEFEILSKWRTYTPDNFVSPNKYISLDTNTMEEEFNCNGFCDEDSIESSIQDRSHSSRSSICAGSSEESQQRTAVSNEGTDYQLDHFAGIEQLDDLFLNSLMEDLPSTEDLHESFCFAPESQYGVLLTNNLTTDLSLDSQKNSSDKHITGSSKYLMTHAFSPSVDCKHGEVVASPFIPPNAEHEFLQVKAPLVKPQVPSEQTIANELLGEELPIEESVLQELKMVMDLLNDKTRICFRDALYRLAENSKQHVVTLAQNGDFPSETPITTHDMDMRHGENKAMESETNVIDRAIANFLYNKMDLHIQDFPAVATRKPKQEGMRATEPPMNQQFHCAMLAGDAEVPSMNGWQQNQVEISQNMLRKT